MGKLILKNQEHLSIVIPLSCSVLARTAGQKRRSLVIRKKGGEDCCFGSENESNSLHQAAYSDFVHPTSEQGTFLSYRLLRKEARVKTSYCET